MKQYELFKRRQKEYGAAASDANMETAVANLKAATPSLRKSLADVALPPALTPPEPEPEQELEIEYAPAQGLEAVDPFAAVYPEEAARLHAQALEEAQQAQADVTEPEGMQV
jgi:hypothetical protein